MVYFWKKKNNKKRSEIISNKTEKQKDRELIKFGRGLELD